MYMHDVHPEQSRAVLLIHPMLASAETLRTLLGTHFPDCRLLIPDLSGHGSAADKPYISAGREADEIRGYLREAGISQLRLGFGASLGGRVLFDLLKAPELQFGHLFFEGTSLFAHAPILEKMVSRVFLSKQRRAQADPPRAVRIMGEMYGDVMAETMARQFIALSPESIRNIAHDCGNNEFPPLTEAQQKRCTFAFGARDGNLKQAKKVLPKQYPHAEVRIWPDCNHCQYITQHPEDYASMLRRYL